VTFLGRQHRVQDRYNAGDASGARHKHSIIHVHTKLTKMERGQMPTGRKVGVATHNTL